MVHPHTEVRFINHDVGHGLFATRLIPRGTITWTKCAFDRVFNPAEVSALAEPYRRIVEIFSYVDTAGDSVLCWDGARNINHCCDRNTLSIIHAVDLAIREIAPGEQITCEYGNCNLLVDLPCLCGSPICRGMIGRDDALRFGDDWDDLVRAALPFANQCEQPLLPFVSEPALVRDILNGSADIRSHTSYFLPHDPALQCRSN